ncbi:MAG: diphosphomevalonate decarboxylase [Gammaproteobacteria bacterium]|jgi:diphosphomevalonate decarboxylase|nr:diphosphomevalonate decarboxylase [Gammaproteobacteria bacterium]MDP6617633.1 diphosphomevalonate decarboxylase [Gammaproteobacteria bacterium]MDP6694510.1 diphosphomevalonate decarboxylase [Gammaproteobacteria bacterium]
MHATAIAHPNVALIKYWGKRDRHANLPAVGSLSLTLSGLETRTTISLDSNSTQDRLVLNGQPDSNAAARAGRCLDLLRERAGIEAGASVESTNNFPTGAGLASSASGFAALVKAGAAALSIDSDADSLAGIARIGSGSAPRSLYEGIVVLENRESGDGESVHCTTVSAPDNWPLAVIVAITSPAAKEIGSTEGMELSRRTSPYYQAWLDTHQADLDAALGAVRERDFDTLASLSERSCLKMHAVAMTSQTPLFYWSAVTVACMHRVWELRHSGKPVFFTIDAGPQVKAVCLPEVAAEVKAALGEVQGVQEVIECGLGQGAWVEP